MSLSFQGWTQGFVENALLFSRTKPGGSARIQAMGGAQVSLGGDFSSALSNPAGLGMYNRSEVTFSSAWNGYDTDSEHLGTKSSDSKNVFNIPGLSYVHHLPFEKNGFLGGSFAISMSRINDFNTSFQYEGVDGASSIVDYFKERAKGYSINSLPYPYDTTQLLNFDVPEGLAYLTFLITPNNEDPNNTTPSMPGDYINYFSDLDTLWNNGVEEIRTQKRYQKVDVKGAQYQWSIAYGGNFNDKLYFGAALGITTLRYAYSGSYQESNFNFSQSPGYDPLNNLNLNEDIVIDGSGLNFTLGLIYRPVQIVQVGLSLVTPTYYSLKDSYNTRLRADWNASTGYGFKDEASEPIISDYNLRTPLKFSSGITFFLGKYGFITGDAEFINYNKSKYDSQTTGVYFNEENDDIKYYYTNVINYRLGAELRYDIFRLRGGYSIQSNPYQSSFNINREIRTISTGAGVRLNKFYVDFALLQSKGDSSFSQYVLDNGTGPVANLQNKMTSAMVTVGFTF
jgi:hypothetical protein